MKTRSFVPRQYRTCRLPLMAVLALAAVASAPAGTTARESFQRDFETLASAPHRLAGIEEGSRAASRYVEERLRELGIREIFVQEFPVVQPRMTQCLLEAEGESCRIFAVRPNAVQASVTPAEGLTADTVYAGKGHIADYGAESPENKIVVLDFDCEKRWLDAFALGAKAVIFVGTGTETALPYHHVNLPANFPRFYAAREQAEKLELTARPRRVRIVASCRWEEMEGRNVIAVLRAGNTPFDPADKTERETLVLAAPLDSYSEIPELAPGARDAANCAGLLYFAACLATNVPQRDVILAFLDGQSRNNLGARAFYGALYRRVGSKKVAEHTIGERIEMIEKEEAYETELIKVLESPDIMAPETGAMSACSAAMRLLGQEAARIGNEVRLTLAPLRVKLAELQKDGGPDAAREIEKLRPTGPSLGAVDALEVDDLCWNSLLRVLNKRTGIDDTQIDKLTRRLINDRDPERLKLKTVLFAKRIRENFGRLIRETRAQCETRMKELATAGKQARQAQAIFEAVGPPRTVIALHVSLNMGDARQLWSIAHGEDSTPYIEDPEPLYTDLFKTICETAVELQEQIPHFDQRPVSGVFHESRLFAPARYADSGGIAAMFKRYNVSLVTVLDAFPRQGLPCDRPDVFDKDAFLVQVEEASRLIRRLADHEYLNMPYPAIVHVLYDETYWSVNRRTGHTVKRLDTGDPMRTTVVPEAVVAAFPVYSGKTAESTWPDCAVEKVPPGFVWPLIVKTGSNGIFELLPCARPSDVRKIAWRSFAASFDLPDSAAGAPGSAASGLISMSSVSSSFGASPQPEFPVGVARVQTKTIAGYGFDRLVPTTVTRATSTARFREDQNLLCEWENIAGLFAPTDATGAKIFNPYGLVLLDNEPTKEGHHGRGIPIGDPFAYPATTAITARDIYTLNEYRLNLLRKNQIGVESLEVLHGRAKDIMADASSGKIASLDRFLGMMEASAAFSRRLYKPLVGVMNDLVTAVVFLLLLALPFAYSLERLLIGTPHIYRRIAWFGGFFVLTFAILFVVNPAFKLAATPIIIFLAFTIVLLSSLVIFIMVRKLESEVKKLRGLSASAHTIDVSRISTMAAAIHMGISTMRRRPVRTLLTSITIVLLTFTILTFASFGNSWGNRQTYVGPLNQPPERVLVRHPLCERISADVAQTLRGFLAGRAEVVPQYWLSPLAEDVRFAEAQDGRSLDMLLATSDAARVLLVSAAVGLDTRDLARLDRLRASVEPDAKIELLDKDGILLPPMLADMLSLTEADAGSAKLLLRGRELTYAGRLKDEFGIQTMVDGASVLPVDYKTSAAGKEVQSDQAGQAPTEEMLSSFVTFNANSVVAVAPGVARNMGAKIRAVSIYPNRPEDAHAVGNDVAVVSALPTYVGTQGGVYRLFFGTIVNASGVSDLLIPVLLGGLIVFGTLLGSVADREREIYTFSSLGLAPVHVAGLFFAEAAIYAIVGGMGGYLLGQASAKILSVLSRYGGFSVPSLNFSSMNAIATIFFVMAIVMLSTVYPAIRAARSANPGIQRIWKLPNPSGDAFDVAFPFTVSEYDLTGVVSFLEEHFNNCRDASVGVFATLNCGIIRQKEIDMLGLKAKVALAPFDLGIEEEFVLLSQPSEVEGIDEVRVLLKRTSGAYGDWRRANRVFVNNIRKQFLIWRTLSDEVTAQYREKTLQRWDALETQARTDIFERFGAKQ